VPLCVTDEIDNRHVRGNVLLLGDQENTKAILSQSRFDGGQAEDIGGSTCIGTQTDAEGVEVLLLSSVDQGLPGVLGSELRNSGPVDDTAALATERDVSLFATQLALLRVGGA
jgi:hypothetical protein